MNEIIDKMIDFIFSKKAYGPILYILIGYILYKIINNIIKSIMSKRSNKKNHKKEDTVINLIRIIIKYIIIIIVSLMIFEIYGVNTTSILASLGIVGAVVGLAFQDTMKNMLAGIFIIFDNRYNVGDTIEINGYKGEVLSLGLQTTKLKSATGEIYTISNSTINNVTNFTESDTLLIIDLGVGYNTDINKLEKILLKLNTKIKKIENVKEDINLLGLDSFGASEMVYKISVLCKPNTHFPIKREILKLIKIEFDKKGIEIPFTQVDLHLIENKSKRTTKKSK